MQPTYQRKARSLRRMSIVFFVVAGLFALAGITFWTITGHLGSNLITVGCAIIIAGSGLSLRTTAGNYEQMSR